MQPTHSRTLWRISGSISPFVTTSDTANRPPGFSTRNASAITRSLFDGKIDDAVGDDHVDGVIGQRDVFNFALQKFDIVDSGRALVLVGERQHLIGHIEPVGFAGGADAVRGKQHVDASAGAEIEHRFAGIERGEQRRIAAAERGFERRLREFSGLRRIVQIAGNGIAAAFERGRSSAAGASSGRRRAARLGRIFLSRHL